MPPPARPAIWNTTPLAGVSHILAIASGKGGVGKSTTALNLALALQTCGQRVGVLDADIYGPSLPRLTGLSGQPAIESGKMIPLETHGLVCMSMGFLMGTQAAVLRGPMISKALAQLLRATAWDKNGPLDFLLVDMPPGTGDIHLSLAQQVPLSGALIVTTPQELAVIDARKALQMFRKVEVPVWGVIENMSYWMQPGGERLALFGEGGGARLAAENGVPLLGQVPFFPEIREGGDAGVLLPAPHPAMPLYQSIASRLIAQANAQAA